MSNRYYTKERFGYGTLDGGNQYISRETLKGKIGAIPDATECPGWDCTIEGQFCPQGLPGSSSRSYLCVNKKWTAAGGGGRSTGVTGRPQYSDLNPGFTDWWLLAPVSRTWPIYEREKAMPGINNDIGGDYVGISEDACRDKCAQKWDEGCKSIEWKDHFNSSGGTCRLSSKQAGKNGAPELIDYIYDLDTESPQWNYSEMDELPVFPDAHTLPDENWWVGSAAPYYDFPQCHIPYGKPCNFGAPKWDPKNKINLKGGECCFGASSCEANTLSSGGTCNTHSNVWNYAHDRMGTDASGCDLQPGSECNYNIGGSGCCKDYRAYGGSDWGCHDGRCQKLDSDGISRGNNAAQNRVYI